MASLRISQLASLIGSDVSANDLAGDRRYERERDKKYRCNQPGQGTLGRYSLLEVSRGQKLILTFRLGQLAQQSWLMVSNCSQAGQQQYGSLWPASINW